MGCAELVAEVEDAVRMRFGGVEVVFGEFEGGKLFDGEVFWELFDREARKAVRHSIETLGLTCRAFILVRGVAD